MLSVEGVVQHDGVGASVRVVQLAVESHSGLEGLEAEDADLVVGLHLLVVGLVIECQGKHSLFLQVGLVDPGEGLDNDGPATEEPWLQSSVFTRRTLAVVLVPEDDPVNARILVLPGNLRDAAVLASLLVLDLKWEQLTRIRYTGIDLIHLLVLLVDGGD